MGAVAAAVLYAQSKWGANIEQVAGSKVLAYRCVCSVAMTELALGDRPRFKIIWFRNPH
jgi:hypothetical protein